MNPPWFSPRVLFFFVVIFFLIRYFPRLHFQCYPKGPPYPPPIPYPPTPPFWPWCSPVLGHIKFASPMGLSLQWWPTRPSFDIYNQPFKFIIWLVIISTSCILFYSLCFVWLIISSNLCFYQLITLGKWYNLLHYITNVCFCHCSIPMTKHHEQANMWNEIFHQGLA